MLVYQRVMEPLKDGQGPKTSPLFSKKGGSTHPPKRKGDCLPIFYEFSEFLRLTHDLGGGFKYFVFSSLSGEMIQFDEHIFQMG